MKLLSEEGLNNGARTLLKNHLLVMLLVLVGGFMISFATLLYVSNELDYRDDVRSKALLSKAFNFRQDAIRTQLSDYADWGDTYRNLHQQLNMEWAWQKQNLGRSLYNNFGYEGVFLVTSDGKTRYSVSEGRLVTQSLEKWLGKDIFPEILAALRQSGGKAVSLFVISDQQLTLLAAKIITPGSDSTVQQQSGSPTVMIFADRITPAELGKLGTEFGVPDARLIGLSSFVSPSNRDTFVIPATEGSAIIGWRSEDIGTILLSRLIPALLMLMVIVAVLAFLATRNLLRKARIHDESIFLLERSMQALTANELRFRDVVETTTNWVWEADSQFRFIWISDRFPSVTGFSIDDWIGRQVHELALNENHVTSLLDKFAESDEEFVLQLQKCRYVSAQNQQRYCNMTVKKVSSAGNRAVYRGAATDVTLVIEAQERVLYLSRHDELTGLANRVKMKEFLTGRLSFQPTAERPLAMVMVDLDKFKAVNDIYGHETGDKVLHETSRRLQACLKDADLVARHGGDEFIIIIPEVEGQDSLEKICAHIIDEIKQPYEVNGNQLLIGASLGISLAPQHAQNANDLLRYSDIALYRAKHEGRNQWVFYQHGMAEKIVQRRELENELREAVDTGQLRLVYQPRYDIKSSVITSVEALVRWDHPSLGTIMPDQFIPLAEETGLIVRLSEWVLTAACRETARSLPGMSVSVNISASEFQDDTLYHRIEKALDLSGLEGFRLEIEITESVMLFDPVKTMNLMNRIRSLGVKFLMDDFGTGYSSLSYLHSYPFDGIKIDKSFIMSVNDSPLAMQVVKNMIGLGKAYEMEVTAEGVETPEQMEQLKNLECDVLQGYYIGKPMTLAQIRQMETDRGFVE